MRETREVKMVCTGRGSHGRTVLGRLEESPVFARDEVRGTESSTGTYEWVAWNTDRWVDPKGRARFKCPRCPLDVKWKPETVQAMGAKVGLEVGVSEIDLSYMPASLR